MMTTKIYKLINALSLRTCVNISGKQVGIRFEGGSCDSSGRIIRPGSLTTSDAKLQAAIEADTQYGGVFQLTEERSDKKEVGVGGNATPNVDPNTTPLGDMDPEVDPKAGTDPTNSKEQVVGVTNAQAAIEWLKTNKAFEFKERPKADAVKAKAAELGVVFVDWK